MGLGLVCKSPSDHMHFPVLCPIHPTPIQSATWRHPRRGSSPHTTIAFFPAKTYLSISTDAHTISLRERTAGASTYVLPKRAYLQLPPSFNINIINILGNAPPFLGPSGALPLHYLYHTTLPISQHFFRFDQLSWFLHQGGTKDLTTGYKGHVGLWLSLNYLIGSWA
jgi:hypothetical protein